MSVSIGSTLKEKLEGSTAFVDMTVGNIRKMIVTFASPACWFTSTLLCVVCYKPMMHSAFRKYERQHGKTSFHGRMKL